MSGDLWFYDAAEDGPPWAGRAALLVTAAAATAGACLVAVLLAGAAYAHGKARR